MYIIKKIYHSLSLILIFYIFLYSNYGSARNLELKIIGNKNLDKEFVESIIDIDSESDNEDLINYVIKELFSTGYFESVTAEIDNNVVIVTLIENPVINEIKFRNNDRFKDQDLEKVIDRKFIDFNIYNEFTTQEIKDELLQHYKNYGYNLSKISYSTKDLNNGQIDIYFDIDEGDVTKIEKINIIGNNSYSTRKIKSILRSSETKFYKLVSGSSKYNANLMIVDERKIEEYYQNQGYKNINVTSSISEFIKDRNKVILNYFIEEGKRFTINNIQILFDDEIVKPDIDINEIIKDLDIKVSKKYNKSKIFKSSEKIYNYLQKNGVVFIDIREIEEEENEFVNLTFFISKINESYVSEIEILGNTRTKDMVLRRELELYEGDPFIPSKIKKSKSNLNNLNFFSKVDIKSISSNDKVKLEVNVEEKATGEFNIGATFDSYNGAALVSSLKENNIFGVGRYLALSVNTSQDNAGINFEVVEPYILNKKFNLIYNLNIETTNLTSSSGYEKDTQTIGLGARYALTDDISHYIKLDYALEDYKSITSSASDSIKNMSGQNVEFILSNRLSLYQLDTRFRPTDGSLLDWYNKLAIDNYILNKISYDRYYNHNKKVFSYRTELANVTSLSSSDVSDVNKFSLGGRKLRGFDLSGVGPRNSSSGYIGGNNLILAQFDYLIPLSEANNNLFDLVTFLDAGKLFSNKTDPTYSTESVRISSGLGLNFNTPLGPLSLTYAVPLQSESYDLKRKFVFSIGWVN